MTVDSFDHRVEIRSALYFLEKNYMSQWETLSENERANISVRVFGAAKNVFQAEGISPQQQVTSLKKAVVLLDEIDAIDRNKPSGVQRNTSREEMTRLIGSIYEALRGIETGAPEVVQNTDNLLVTKINLRGLSTYTRNACMMPLINGWRLLESDQSHLKGRLDDQFEFDDRILRLVDMELSVSNYPAAYRTLKLDFRDVSIVFREQEDFVRIFPPVIQGMIIEYCLTPTFDRYQCTNYLEGSGYQLTRCPQII